MTRTAQKVFRLLDPEFKETIHRIIYEYAEIYYVEVHAHAFLDNHYHLAINLT